MKIRSDFVTNSSSDCSVMIRVQSKELTELLAKYRELFGEDVQIRPEGLLMEVEDGWTEDGWGNVPQSLEQLLDKLLECLAGEILLGLLNGPLARQMEREMKANKRELTDSIQRVEWDFQSLNPLEYGNIGRKRFVYDRDEGGSGEYWEEPYHEEDYEFDFGEKYDKEKEE